MGNRHGNEPWLPWADGCIGRLGCAMMRFWMLLWRWLGWGVLWILLIIYIYSYEFQLFLLISLLSLHVTMQMSLLLLCPCSHMFSLIFSLIYRCWLSLLSNLGDSLACHGIPCRQAWSQQQSGRRKKQSRNRGRIAGGTIWMVAHPSGVRWG